MIRTPIPPEILERRASGGLDWIFTVLPQPAVLRLRPGWQIIQRAPDGYAWAYAGGLRVIASGAREQDGKRWVHVSLSRATRLPSYEDLCLVKEIFIGTDREAYQVFARRAKHVNIHPFTLHLWHCVDGDPLPDFTEGLGTI